MSLPEEPTEHLRNRRAPSINPRKTPEMIRRAHEAYCRRNGELEVEWNEEAFDRDLTLWRLIE